MESPKIRKTRIGKSVKRILAGVASAGVLLGAGACGNASQSADNKVLQFWDPYTNRKAGSPWDKQVTKCAPAGYRIQRRSMPQNDVLNQLTTAVKADNAPDIAIIDNPFVVGAQDSGLITNLKDSGVKVDGFDSNIQGPGKIDGGQYGLAFGANALGLWYNPKIIEKAGVDVSTIKDWDSLNAAIKKVVDSGAKGITFSGITGEEGVFQYLPWFLSAGGDLKDVNKGTAKQDSYDLLSSWVKQGWAPKSAATDNQSAAWDVFLTGEYGFAENGSWQSEEGAKNGYKLIPLPGKHGGIAAGVTGGEFITLPTHKKANKDRVKLAAGMINCLTGDKNLLQVADALGYFASKKSVREQQVAKNPMWQPWMPIADKVVGRTAKVGLQYETTSADLSEQLQKALNS